MAYSKTVVKCQYANTPAYHYYERELFAESYQFQPRQFVSVFSLDRDAASVKKQCYKYA